MRTKIFYIYFLLAACIAEILLPCNAQGANAEQQFYRTDAAYRKFLASPEKLKYRENWLVYVEEFRKAYKLDPSGNLAPAALYMTGEVYQELYKRSFKISDKKEAADAFERVIKRYPKSDYRAKAERALAKFFPKQTDDQIKEIKPAELKKPKSQDIGNKEKPKSQDIGNKVRDRMFSQSKEAYKQRIKEAPEKTAPPRPLKSSRSDKDKPDEDTPAATFPAGSSDTTITDVRFWSNPHYTRIVIDADKDTSYTYRMLEKDPAANKPYRLYIDFDKSRLGEGIKKFIPINDNLLIDARASQYQADLVRVVVDIKSFGTYKIFPIRNPFRTIIDVWGGDDSQKYTKKAEEKLAEIKLPKAESPEPRDVPEKTPSRTKPTDIAKSLALGVRRIVIDPGHGGKDAGAVGYHKNVLEKNIVLSIGKRLARRIRQELGCEVIMTRTTDRFIGLEERTAIANTKNADLFISIHTNAHTNRRAYGIETYFLNLATDDEAIRVAARENATSRKNISDLEKILNDLMQNAKINESSRLAAHVQKSLYQGMKRRYSNVKNKGVKQAPFYVLLGAQMPSILVETSFISHKRECERLNNPVYQEHLCDAIVSGIRKYIEETNPTALRRPQRNLGMRD